MFRRKKQQPTEPTIDPMEVAIGDYVKWLEGYLLDGGKPTSYHDHDWSSWDFEIFAQDFTLDNSRKNSAPAYIIALPGAQYVGDEIGKRTTIFSYDIYTGKHIVTGRNVPVYKNSEFQQIPGIKEYIELKKEHDAKIDDLLEKHHDGKISYKEYSETRDAQWGKYEQGIDDLFASYYSSKNPSPNKTDGPDMNFIDLIRGKQLKHNDVRTK